MTINCSASEVRTNVHIDTAINSGLYATRSYNTDRLLKAPEVLCVDIFCVKKLEQKLCPSWTQWYSVPPSVKPWLPAGKWWIALFGLGVSRCPKGKSSSGSCSWLGAEWNLMDLTLTLYQTEGGSWAGKAKLWICQSVYHLCCELWGVTKEIRLWLKWYSRVGWPDSTLESSDIRRDLRVELMLLRIERGQLMWFRHLIRMPHGCFTLEVHCACSTSRRPQSRPRTHWRKKKLKKELDHMAGERDVWTTLLNILPLRPSPW